MGGVEQIRLFRPRGGSRLPTDRLVHCFAHLIEPPMGAGQATLAVGGAAMGGSRSGEGEFELMLHSWSFFLEAAYGPRSDIRCPST